MKHLRNQVFASIVALCGLTTFAAQAMAQPETRPAAPPTAPPSPSDAAATTTNPPEAKAEENNGQDPMRPLTRLDLRFKYQNLPGDTQAELFTLRVDKPFVLDGGWIFAARADLPFINSDVPSSDNPGGDNAQGVADSLFQGLFITPPLDSENRWAAGFGAQFIFPTGSQDQFGQGKWQLAPIIAARYSIPELGKGSFAALLVKDQFSYAGDDDRRDINDLFVQPIFSWSLPDQWFVGSSPEMRFNMKDDGSAFVPLDINVGKMIAPGVVGSVQFDVPIVDDYEQYDWQVEFRIGFFF